MASKTSYAGFDILALSLISVLLLLILSPKRKTSSLPTPQNRIRAALAKLGFNSRLIDYWTAVSAFETAGWTSKVFKESNNPFNLIVKNSNRLPYGEGQTVFNSIEEGTAALVSKVLKPYKYPADFSRLQDMTDTMKEKGFYTSDKNQYYQGVLHWYDQMQTGNVA